MEYLIVLNKPLSASKRSELASLGQVLDVPREKDICELIREEYGGEDALVGVGGDGTHSKVVRSSMEHDRPAILVPLGSGNDFNEALGAPTYDDYLAAMDSSSFETKKSDAISFRTEGSDYTSIVGVHLGLFADASNLGRFWTATKRYLRNKTYVLKGVLDIARARRQSVEITLNGESHDITLWAGHIANVPTTGGQKVVITDVSQNDGEAKLCYLHGECPKYRLPSYVQRLHEIDELQPTRNHGGIRDFQIHGEVNLGYDGEYIGWVDHLEGEVVSDAFEVLIPSNI